ncbi:MAG: hypothetical protein PHE26_09075 [Syntrophomonadaceae bacterium]|nr:hypothetical protein [Syntrophomonadaceae bacterium]
MKNENTLRTLTSTSKKIADLKGFNIPITLKVIADYEEAGIDQYFIDQQKLQLQKYLVMVAELAAKAERLLECYQGDGSVDRPGMA